MLRTFFSKITELILFSDTIMLDSKSSLYNWYNPQLGSSEKILTFTPDMTPRYSFCTTRMDQP